jgi:endonuclease/exonuclease/phosphatase family metal-dependent hydrolase
VYGPQDTEAKIQFLHELSGIEHDCLDPWLIAGDFNLIYDEEDKNNQNLDQAMMGRSSARLNGRASSLTVCCIVQPPRTHITAP